ncbi:Acetyltransferase (GNAT) domain-containing protein [Pedococcus dokdonensis]|uniref:Acetyltransferase (GNAT) domain-containing protein n=1 Tax=Pedococcus dokdonensis TaxID=443156 RepID=A0A1H0KNM3_9MICO|nr:NUDIX hydrolase [Pedococcus dokdonensis]SDO57465.1 Acetyltransferase (GNAT) domain-containing protein [Pedococcus dokdonensis]
MPTPELPDLSDGDDLVLRGVPPQDGDDDAFAFVVVWEGEQVGRVEVIVDGSGDADLIWAVVADYREVGIVERALRLVVGWTFASLDVHRVEARVPDAERSSVRAALRAGMRKEGVARGSLVERGERGDVMVLARLRDDAEPDSRDGFIALLNSSLPTKRAIAQGVLRDREGRVLLCELTYKAEWDLPGGVVDPSESPATCLVREVREELAIDVEVQGLLAVNWLPPWRGWSDATVFVFDLGVADPDLIARTTLERREIRALHFAAEEEWEARVAPYNQRLLAFLATHAGPTAYLEDGLPAL